MWSQMLSRPTILSKPAFFSTTDWHRFTRKNILWKSVLICGQSRFSARGGRPQMPEILFLINSRRCHRGGTAVSSWWYWSVIVVGLEFHRGGTFGVTTSLEISPLFGDVKNFSWRGCAGSISSAVFWALSNCAASGFSVSKAFSSLTTERPMA